MSLAENPVFVPPPPPAPPAPPPPSFSLPKPNKNTIEFCEKTLQEELNLTTERILSANDTYTQLFLISNTFLRPQLQHGPQCGLVALSIASSISDNFVPVDEIFNLAYSQGFTKQGEIFDAKFLASLAKECCKFKATLLQGGLHHHLQCIINSILNKNLLLVPYDADFNNSPCCKKGFKAHWAVTTGLVIFEKNEFGPSDTDKKEVMAINSQNDSSCDCLKNKTNLNTKSSVNLFISKGQIIIGKEFYTHSDNIGDIRQGEIYLIGIQGKSNHLGLWLFNDMAESNSNLVCFSPDRDSQNYIIPEGGLTEGLKGKFIILEK